MAVHCVGGDEIFWAEKGGNGIVTSINDFNRERRAEEPSTKERAAKSGLGVIKNS